MADKILEGVSVYKGKPLVKKDNIICYGDPNDKAVLVLTVLTFKDVHGEQVPNDILIQIQSTDKNLSVVERSLKQGMKKGLFDALDYGISWLNNALQ
ncbi:MAG: hypothetical protein E7613_09360 [Ruminococcaceae bacterium]|nr:hypothetical protein [Oscillospiraceae bacterium]